MTASRKTTRRLVLLDFFCYFLQQWQKVERPIIKSIIFPWIFTPQYCGAGCHSLRSFPAYRRQARNNDGHFLLANPSHFAIHQLAHFVQNYVQYITANS